jgi:hypothetical protein
MIHEKELEALAKQWQTRLDESDFDPTLNDCIYDLLKIINNSYAEQDFNKLPPEEIKDYLLQQEADAYLASMEAHEHYS